LNNYKEQLTCKLCYSINLTLIGDLGETPLANEYVNNTETKQEYYPLQLMLCEKCGNVQIRHTINPDIIFDEYVYVTGSSPGLVKHFQNYADTIQNQIPKESLIVEIGSNDGTLLMMLQNYGHSVVGIEPGNIPSKISLNRGIFTIKEYFTSESAMDVLNTHGKADLVIANNVMAHIENINDVVDGIKILLEENGLFTMEIQYLRDVIEKKLIDTNYHEHRFIHSIKSLASFFSNKDMKIEKVERINTHGGSIRLYVRNSRGIHGDSIIGMISEEKTIKLHERETYDKLFIDAKITGAELRGYIRAMKDENKKIFGYGAPAKMTTLVHFLDVPKVEGVFEDNPDKIGKYTPGQHVPIVSSKEIHNLNPDIIIVFAWNEKDAIIKKLKDINYKGKILIPMPSLYIL